MSNETKKRGGIRPPTNETLVIPQIASMLALGKSTTEIAQTLNLGFNTVKKLAGRDETKAILKEIADSFKEASKAVAMKQVSEMTDLALEGLKLALKDGNVQAIQTHFKVIGLLGAEDQKTTRGEGPLVVVMPGASYEPAAINVESDVKDEH